MVAGIGCCAALGAAEAMRPRRLVSAMPAGRKLTDLVPRAFDGFVEGGSGDIVVPRTDGSLVATLYSDLLTRLYRRMESSDPSIMLLVAYGPAQTDVLQLHRPENCYPAGGFTIISRSLATLQCGRAGTVPAVQLTATQGTRVEDVVYWTRVGDALPRSFGEQSWARLRQSIGGEIADGTLLRASAVRSGPQPQFDLIRRFLEALVPALPVEAGPLLIGRAIQRAPIRRGEA
jgi:EpsI family protein